MPTKIRKRQKKHKIDNYVQKVNFRFSLFHFEPICDIKIGATFSKIILELKTHKKETILK